DPLIAKLAVWAGSRDAAIGRMLRALSEYDVGGIRTTIPFFKRILADAEFRSGQLDTGMIGAFMARDSQEAAPGDAGLVAALLRRCIRAARTATRRRSAPAADGWNPEEWTHCDEAFAHARRRR